MKKLLPIAIFSLFTLSSCHDFLSVIPDNRTEIENEQQIGELLTSAYPNAYYAPFLTGRTDNVSDVGPGNGNRTEIYNTESFFWRDTDIQEEDTPTYYWTTAYQAIASANQAIDAINTFYKADEKQMSKKAQGLMAEALLCRAYAHFMLVNIWAEHYDPATAASMLGVPYVEAVENEPLKNYTRASVQEVYDKIERDINAAMPLVYDGIYQKPKYHFNFQAACAFASRFYLYKGDWDKVIDYANKLFGGAGPESFTRAWATVYTGKTLAEIRRFYPSVEEPTNLLLCVASSVYNRTYLNLRYRLGFNDFTKLLRAGNLADPDGRWAYRIYYAGTDYTYFVPKFEEYFKVIESINRIGYPYITYVALSADEAWFNLMEAQIMKGMYSEALAGMNKLLRHRTPARRFKEVTMTSVTDKYRNRNQYKPFYQLPTGDGIALLNMLLEIRRREFLFEGLRWFDIKRFHMRVRHVDNLQIRYYLEPESPNRALQIPTVATVRGIAPNPR